MLVLSGINISTSILLYFFTASIENRNVAYHTKHKTSHDVLVLSIFNQTKIYVALHMYSAGYLQNVLRKTKHMDCPEERFRSKPDRSKQVLVRSGRAKTGETWG